MRQKPHRVSFIIPLTFKIKQKSPEGLASGRRWGGDLLSRCDAVPSALAGLTALFGMGRGVPRRRSRPKSCPLLRGIVFYVVACERSRKPGSCRGSVGPLVLLGFGVTAFTPAAYQRGSLPRPSREASSWGGLRA